MAHFTRPNPLCWQSRWPGPASDAFCLVERRINSGLAGVGLRGCDIDARPAGFGHGVTHSAGGRRRFHTDQGIRLGRLASTCDWTFFRPCGANVFSKKPFIPHAPVHVALTVALDPGPSGATVQLVSMVELASFSR